MNRARNTAGEFTRRATILLVIATVTVFLMVSSSLTFAQECQPESILLFDATATFQSTASSSRPGSAETYASTSLEKFSLQPGQTAKISSTPDGTGDIVIDNFLTINGVNVCKGAPGQLPFESCFGDLLLEPIEVGLPIETFLEPIPALDVTNFIPVGPARFFQFDLRDFGGIAGNTDLYLVITCADG